MFFPFLKEGDVRERLKGKSLFVVFFEGGFMTKNFPDVPFFQLLLRGLEAEHLKNFGILQTDSTALHGGEDLPVVPLVMVLEDRHLSLLLHGEYNAGFAPCGAHS